MLGPSCFLARRAETLPVPWSHGKQTGFRQCSHAELVDHRPSGKFYKDETHGQAITRCLESGEAASMKLYLRAHADDKGRLSHAILAAFGGPGSKASGQFGL